MKPDLPAIEARCKTIARDLRYRVPLEPALDKLLTQDIPALLDYIAELEAELVDLRFGLQPLDAAKRRFRL